MPRFRVTFRKIVYGDMGLARAICQRIVDVDARDAGSAEAAATRRFCDLETTTCWLDHADWMEIARVGRAVARRSVGEREARRAA